MGKRVHGTHKIRQIRVLDQNQPSGRGELLSVDFDTQQQDYSDLAVVASHGSQKAGEVRTGVLGG